MKKSDLQTGMLVRNIVSGNIGEIRLRKDEEVFNDDYVVVRRRIAGRYDYPIWIISNLELVPK